MLRRRDSNPRDRCGIFPVQPTIESCAAGMGAKMTVGLVVRFLSSLLQCFDPLI